MTQVDIALLLAVDVSASVDRTEFELMIGGLAEAWRHPSVHAALAAQRLGQVGVAVMFWSEAQELIIPWRVVSDAAGASSLAAALLDAPRTPRPAATALGEALVEALRLLVACPFPARRAVLDVSGDGRSNRGRAAGPLRDIVVSAGVTINALAVLNEEPDLLSYFHTEVIGGAGAFAVACQDYADFQSAILRKLLREISVEATASS